MGTAIKHPVLSAEVLAGTPPAVDWKRPRRTWL